MPILIIVIFYSFFANALMILSELCGESSVVHHCSYTSPIERLILVKSISFNRPINSSGKRDFIILFSDINRIWWYCSYGYNTRTNDTAFSYFQFCKHNGSNPIHTSFPTIISIFPFLCGAFMPLYTLAKNKNALIFL